MKIRDLQEGTFKNYCLDTSIKESVKRHFAEKEFRVYYNDSNVIPFNSMRKEWGIFSNFYPCPLIYDGVRFHSSEQMYYYYVTTQNRKLQQLIMQQPTAYRVKKLHIPFEERDKGHDRVSVMRRCLRTKFEQCADFRDALLSTKNKILIEYATWWDLYWGCYLKGNYYIGCNALGRLLMELRNNNIG